MLGLTAMPARCEAASEVGSYRSSSVRHSSDVDQPQRGVTGGVCSFPKEKLGCSERRKL